MNEQELRQLAELINTKWPDTAVLFGSGLVLKRNCETFHLSDTDSQNAKFIIWCLDRLEELGFTCALYRDSVYLERDGIGEGVDGETRAFACAYTLLRVLSA